jgi:hypothetical protein
MFIEDRSAIYDKTNVVDMQVKPKVAEAGCIQANSGVYSTEHR